MRHEEMTSSFVQYDVGNLVLMLNSYLLVCSPLILSMAVCCVEVLYHYMSQGRGIEFHLLSFPQFLLASYTHECIGQRLFVAIFRKFLC